MSSPMPHAHAGRATVAALLGAVVTALLLAGCALGGPSATVEPATRTWYDQHKQVVYRLMIDADRVAHPSSRVSDYHSFCDDLASSTKAARALPPAPDKVVAKNLRIALGLFDDAVANCERSFTAQLNTGFIDQATTYRLRGMNSASFGEVRIRTVMGYLGDSVTGLPTVSTTSTASTSTTTAPTTTATT